MERSAFQLLLDNIQSHHCHVPAEMSFRSICVIWVPPILVSPYFVLRVSSVLFTRPTREPKTSVAATEEVNQP